MLLIFRKNFNFESIEGDRLHKVALAKDRMRELVKFAYVLFKNNGTGEIERLTKLMQNRNPFL